MTVWLRDIQARLSTPPEFPDGLESWSQSGKGQFRAFDNVGRVWQEVYSAFDMKTAVGRAFIASLNKSRREKTLWDVQHPQLRENYGIGGGVPLVAGAAQTGDTLDIQGGPVSTANWLRKGDLFKIAGISLVFDVMDDVDTDSSGEASIPMSPPIFVGGSPANLAALTIDASAIYFRALLVGIQMPDMEADGVLFPGLQLTWREQP